ncbi:MAG: TlpA family protein disulfide reductase [Chloroflexi bacterium]|nr:TlpA family protein disulfide reductase [Chloroflexota bacterium]
MKIPARVLALTISGIGLILLGVAAYFFLPASQQNGTNDPAAATDFSSVPAKVQYDAPALTLSDISGVQHSLSDYRGQVVLVNLWATWCPPCKAEMPVLQAFYSKYREAGFTVIAVEDGDPTADVIAFVKDYGLTFPVWLDPTYQASDHAFKTPNLPSSYVIDRNGRVRLAWVGAISEGNLEKYTAPIIKE